MHDAVVPKGCAVRVTDTDSGLTSNEVKVTIG